MTRAFTLLRQNAPPGRARMNGLKQRRVTLSFSGCPARESGEALLCDYSESILPSIGWKYYSVAIMSTKNIPFVKPI